MYKAFSQWPLILRFILLILPPTGWVAELVLRFDIWSHNKTNINLIVAILTIFFGSIIGIVDSIVTLINGDIVKLK